MHSINVLLSQNVKEQREPDRRSNTDVIAIVLCDRTVQKRI